MARQPIPLPRFGEGVNTATLVEWLVEPGAAVARGDDLAEVETAKAVLTVAAPCDGVLGAHGAAPGDELEVGAQIGHIVTDGADDEPAPASTPGANGSARAPSAGRLPAVGGEAGAITAAAPPPAVAATGAGYHSPRLRGRLNELGLTAADLAAVPGTGRGGRVTAEDLERFLAEVDELEHENASAMRAAVADGMRRSWSRPLATVARRIELDPLLTHRRTIEGRPSLTIYAAKALGVALAKDPRLARRLVGRKLLAPKRFHIAIAAEADDGILLPILLDADRRGLAELADAHDHALDGGHVHHHGERAVATVTNYGTLKLTWAIPIPPADQSLILGVGKPDFVPVWDPTIKGWGRGKVCELTLTFDHRIGDGAAAAMLLHHVARVLEQPGLLEQV